MYQDADGNLRFARGAANEIRVSPEGDCDSPAALALEEISPEMLAAFEELLSAWLLANFEVIEAGGLPNSEQLALELLRWSLQCREVSQKLD